MRFSILFLSLVFLSSCTPISKLILGIKKPKVESENSITKFMDSKGLPSADCYVFDDSIYVNVLQNNQRYVGAYEVFNSDWNKLVPTDSLTNQCYGRIDLALSQINETGTWMKDSVENYTSDLLQNHLLSLDKQDRILIDLDPNEHLVVFYWAKFMGGSTKNLLNIQNDLIASNVENLKIININMDIRNNMDEKYKDIHFNVKKKKETSE